MALKFRTRLNLTFTVLLFLVVVVMTFAQVGILFYDTWINNWYKGRILTQVITPNISYGLAMKDGSDQYLDAMADLYETLNQDLRELAEAQDPSAANLDRIRQASEQMRLESEGDVRELFNVQPLLERNMIEEEFWMMMIVDGDGTVLAEVTRSDFTPTDTLRLEVNKFVNEFMTNAKESGQESADFDFFGTDIGVISTLDYIDPGGQPYGLFVMHSGTRQAQMIGDRLGIVAVIGTFLFFVALVTCVFVSRGLTKPLLELSRGAKAFGEGNLNYRMKLRRKDEFNELAQSFNVMAISIQEYMHELERETGRRERLESEFRIASEMQEALLPDAPPEVPGLDIIGWSRPSKEVGGDFYDFLEMDDGKIGLVVGDATGKGVPAALLTTQCASVLRTLSSQFHNPSELLYRTNNEFYKRVGTTHRFVTLFLMVIDPATGIARYASAGHPSPAVVRAESGKSEWLKDSTGFPLGIMSKASYEEHDIVFRPGDSVYIFSDGLSDAQNHKGEFYGEEAVRMSMASAYTESAEGILRATRRDVERYMNGKEASDDMTVIVTKYQSRDS